MAASIEDIARKVELLRADCRDRDARMGDLLEMRRGNIEAVFPDILPEDWQRPIIANFVDIVARDLAEVIAPLPTFSCSSSSMVSDKARKFADKKTKIVHGYVDQSALDVQLVSGADRYLCYGFMVIYLEPDFETKMPRILVEDSLGAYPEFDRFGRLKSLTRVIRKKAWQLANEYPEYAGRLLGDGQHAEHRDALLEVIRFCDADQIVLYVPSLHNTVLATAKSPTPGRCPAVVLRRPGLDDEMRGQFDDVIAVQAAREVMAQLGLEAVQKSVQAPLALPTDVQEMAFGSDAIIRTQSPEKIRRVGVELPQGAFVESQFLDQELHTGARYPNARQGGINASVITGRGVQELMGGFDTQVRTAQLVFRRGLKQVIELCFAMDEHVWPSTDKDVRGQANGTPFEITYRPSRDIAGDYLVDVTYGLAAGMDPNRALVFLLQLRGDKAISKDLLMRQVPIDMDVTEEQQRIYVEETRDALMQAVFGYSQAIPALAQAGADPADVLLKLGTIISAIQKGKAVEAAVSEAFAPQTPPGPLTPGAAGGPGNQASGPGGSPAGPGGPGGHMSLSGLMPGVAAGQAGLPPGGRPTLQTLLAGIGSGGQPDLSSNVRRRLPV